MKIETSYLSINHLFDDIKNGRIIVPDYQREYCWDSEKIEKFIDSVQKNIPIGVFQFRKLEGFERKEVVDGLHRIRTLFNVMLGKGFYFNFDKKTFTQNPADFDYSKYSTDSKNSLNPFSLGNAYGVLKQEEHHALLEEFLKFYNIQLLYFMYSGTDEEIKIAFERINETGVAFTPIFKQVEKSSTLTL